MKKLAVATYPGHTIEQMFSRWSPFFAEGISERPMYMLKCHLQTRGIELISLEEMGSNPNICEAVLHFTPFCKSILQKYPNLRHIYIASEPSVVLVLHSAVGIKHIAKNVFDAVITPYHDVKFKNVYNIIYPRGFPCHSLENETERSTRKLACMFAADKYAIGNRDLYAERRKIICAFEKNWPQEFGLYGVNWGEPYKNFSVYHGPAEDKMEESKQYKFNICLSNEQGRPGDIDEKIFDAMIAGTVPVYAGVSDIESFVPMECFVDYRQFDTPEECIEYLRNMPEETYQAYLNAGQLYIKDTKTREKFSAKDMADKIQLACQETELKAHRTILWLDFYFQLQRVYGKMCGVQKRIENARARRYLRE